jgi:hypothetical protein
MHWSSKTTIALALAALAGGGCSTFQDESTIIDLRILGIKADPPEIYVDPSTLASQTAPFKSTFTALVVDPKGNGRAISYDVLACPRDIDTVTAATGHNGVICQPNVAGQTPNSYEVISPSTPAVTTDPGPEHDISFDFNVPPSLLALAYTVDPNALNKGFQLPVVVQMELGAGSENIVTTKRLIFSQQLPDRPAQAPNQNPEVTTVTTYGARDANLDPISPTPLDPSAPVMVPLGGTLWFEPGGAVAEAYSTRTLTRDNPPQVVTTDVAAETLRFAFFTTAGTFTPVETSTATSAIFTKPDRPHLESQYTAPTKMPDNPLLTVWIVARDERGGASWVTRQIQLIQP